MERRLKYPKCPYCKTEIKKWFDCLGGEYYADQVGQICPNCNKDMIIKRIETIEFRARKAK